jgi:hypothetical protein
MTVAALALPMPKLIMVMPSAVATLGIGRSGPGSSPPDGTREDVEVVAEVGQQDVLAESVQRHAGVARQPVLDDFLFFFHLLLPLRIRAIVEGRCWQSQGEGRTLARPPEGASPCPK